VARSKLRGKRQIPQRGVKIRMPWNTTSPANNHHPHHHHHQQVSRVDISQALADIKPGSSLSSLLSRSRTKPTFSFYKHTFK